MLRSPLRQFGLAALLTMLVSSVAIAGPPWIAIEYPVNPHDAGTRGALLTVRTYHHGELMSYDVTGTAEGIVDGGVNQCRSTFVASHRSACMQCAGRSQRKERGCLSLQASKMDHMRRLRL